MKLLLQLLFIHISLLACSQSNYSVKEIPHEIREKYVNFIELPEISSKPFYFSKTILSNKKIKDYTDVIQKAINENHIVVMPDYAIKVNKNGLLIPSNRILFFQKNSKIIFSGPADSRSSDIIKIYDSKNVKIYNPQIVGSKLSNVKQEGEWSAGIAIIGSENVDIYNVDISQTYGDGIIVANQSKNIVIKNGIISEARRDGISITSGINVSIQNLVIGNTNGTLPECGIQIEPDFPSDNLQNINISNIIGFNNKNSTLNVNLGPLNQNEKKYSPKVSITANNITDYLSNYTIGIVKNADNKKYTSEGFIKFMNIKSISSQNLFWQDNGKTNVEIKFQSVLNKDGSLYKYE